jgi:ring-1,2-phenylacetyl-CoA epoxidase subunit PaaE
MGIFGNIFKSKENKSKKNNPKGFFELRVKSVEKLSSDTVKVHFDVPSDLKVKFSYIPGQYINLLVDINGNEERRSYSICSGVEEDLAVAIKEVSNGTVSLWANKELEEGEILLVSAPQGNFTLNKNAKKIVCIAAGSGITPIMSIAKYVEKNEGEIQLFFANKTENNIIFKNEIDLLLKTKTRYYLTQEPKENFGFGRLNKEKISEIIKEDLSILKADDFYICGPEEMIFDAIEVLNLFGVSKEKVHYELFTTPTKLIEKEKSSEVNNFSGISNVKIILDDETIQFKINSKGKSILETVVDEGYDAPYSCRGGVCCTCKAKVLEGKAVMKLNYSLSDKEVEEGFILTCQAQPASENLTISYDV